MIFQSPTTAKKFYCAILRTESVFFISYTLRIDSRTDSQRLRFITSVPKWKDWKEEENVPPLNDSLNSIGHAKLNHRAILKKLTSSSIHKRVYIHGSQDSIVWKLHNTFAGARRRLDCLRAIKGRRKRHEQVERQVK